MAIHVYPGMGATSEMYRGLWKEQPFIFHDWPDLAGETSITGYSSRLIREHEIHAGDILIGSSLGGIIACEVANQLEILRLILLGSARSRTEIHALLQIVHPMIDYAPVSFIRALAGKIPMDLSIMFHQSDPAFIRTMCKAIFAWDGLESETPVTRVHGTRDMVIPRPEDCDIDIQGGHLIAMTHPEECLQAVQHAVGSSRE